uniref:Uncharacterized protein n=1 Tax=Glossina morsitans morsitans TaxID=37546 RepID=A0A1B0FNT5_GLOMM
MRAKLPSLTHAFNLYKGIKTFSKRLLYLSNWKSLKKLNKVHLTTSIEVNYAMFPC